MHYYLNQPLKSYLGQDKKKIMIQQTSTFQQRLLFLKSILVELHCSLCTQQQCSSVELNPFWPQWTEVHHKTLCKLSCLSLSLLDETNRCYVLLTASFMWGDFISASQPGNSCHRSEQHSWINTAAETHSNQARCHKLYTRGGQIVVRGSNLANPAAKTFAQIIIVYRPNYLIFSNMHYYL